MHKSILCPLLLIIINEAGVLVGRGQFMPQDRKTSTFAVQVRVSVSSCFFCLTLFCLSMHSIQCNKQFPHSKSITDTTLQYIVRIVPVPIFPSTCQFHYILLRPPFPHPPLLLVSLSLLQFPCITYRSTFL